MSASGTKVSMLLSLLLANTRMLAKIKIKVKLALPIPTGAPTTLVNEMIDTPPVVALKTIKILTVCSCHVTYAFESESTLYSCLNVKEFLARSRREI